MGGAEVALLILAGFVALTAIGGGIALAAGLEGERFPAEWLEGSPFEDYRVPGLILAGVGGEIRMLNQPSAPTATEVLYLAFATAMVVLGVVVV